MVALCTSFHIFLVAGHTKPPGATLFAPLRRYAQCLILGTAQHQPACSGNMSFNQKILQVFPTLLLAYGRA
jgi:hypothetical protein